ncbi:hypothetical protein ABH935_003395 [Catenulispora sp. GAS73]|uniref:DUF4193 domain-containing protein n=1 Tax=Catenulispora sp. GAS73 TaxID=3156269 RepID=UPI003511E34C
MATDYDVPRKTDEDLAENGTEDGRARRAEAAGGLADLEEIDNEPLDLPRADLSGEELTVLVLPRQADEFTCTNCFLVHHRNLLARRKRGVMLCCDCA